jgi:hypothetical protein
MVDGLDQTPNATRHMSVSKPGSITSRESQSRYRDDSEHVQLSSALPRCNIRVILLNDALVTPDYRRRNSASLLDKFASSLLLKNDRKHVLYLCLDGRNSSGVIMFSRNTVWGPVRNLDGRTIS